MSLEGPNSVQVNYQIRKWNAINRHGQSGVRGDAKKKERGPVITISREPGCGSETLGKLLAKDHGLDLFGIGLVDMISKATKLSQQMVETLDEKSQSALEDWLGESFFGDRLSSRRYLLNLRSVMYTISAHGSAVIIGRGGAFILPPEERLAIRLVAPLDVRVKHIMKKFRLSEKEALSFIQEKSLERRRFTKKLFKADFEDPTNYDITFNTALIKPKMISEIVGTLISDRTRTGRDR